MNTQAAGRSSDRYERAKHIFEHNNGIMRTMDAVRKGIHPTTLYTLRDRGVLEAVSRGVYRLANRQPSGNPDLLVIATRVPHGVICLISALSFHELTTQIPHSVHVALSRGAEQPRIDYPPTSFYRFSKLAHSAGINTHLLDGIQVRIYDAEKTLADCFKFRNKIGMDTVIESLRFYFERRRVNLDLLMYYADICRVGRIMRPYLNAMV